MQTFVHAGPGNVQAGINEDNIAFATLTFPSGEIKHFEEPIDHSKEGYRYVSCPQPQSNKFRLYEV